MYLILSHLLPKFNAEKQRWTNTERMYLKHDDNPKWLNFDLDLKIITLEKSNIEFLATKSTSVSTYREEPFLYHAEIVKIITKIIDLSSNLEFFMVKIKEIFSLKYAFEILYSQDGFTLNKGQLKPENKQQVDMIRWVKANSYLKVQSIQLFKMLFFSPSSLKTIRVVEYSELLLELLAFEKFRFEVLDYQTVIQSYPDLLNLFESDRTTDAEYQKRLMSQAQIEMESKDPEHAAANRSVYESGRRKSYP